MTIEQAMTHEGAEMLGNMAKHWLEEAARLEASTRDPTFEEEVGDVLTMIDLLHEYDLVSWNDLDKRKEVKLEKLKKWSNLL